MLYRWNCGNSIKKRLIQPNGSSTIIHCRWSSWSEAKIDFNVLYFALPLHQGIPELTLHSSVTAGVPYQVRRIRNNVFLRKRPFYGCSAQTHQSVRIFNGCTTNRSRFFHALFANSLYLLCFSDDSLFNVRVVNGVILLKLNLLLKLTTN